MTFKELHLIEPILRALDNAEYEIPTPIQTQAIPVLLEGKDVLGSAQTGTGKTAAFACPILQNLYLRKPLAKGPRKIKALVLTPTRELALQIQESFAMYGQFVGLKTVVIFGGVPQRPQENHLKSGLDILVATPGRLLDLYGQKLIDFSGIEFFVLDEADRMLDMGFINDVKKIISYLPTKRQTMLFSATMPAEIAKLATSILIDPVRIAVVPVETTLDAIDQKLFFVTKKNKTNLLISLLDDKTIVSALVFSRTKHGANKIVKDLGMAHVEAEAIHGNKSQSARQAALNKFKNKEVRVLVATDIAARGIDIDHLSHVFNYDLPEVPEMYIHRIGRTGRAGLEGSAISFCAEEELPLLKDIERHIKKPVPVVKNHPFAAVFSDAPVSASSSGKKPQPAPKKVEPKAFSRYDAKNHSSPKKVEPKAFSRFDAQKTTPVAKPNPPATPKPVVSSPVQNRYVPKKTVYHTPKPKNSPK